MKAASCTSTSSRRRELVDTRNWRHRDVGWGLVLPDPVDEALSNSDRAGVADAPEPIQRLFQERPYASVLRYRADLHDRHLRRYYPDGSAQDLSIIGTEVGTAKARIPLLIGME